MSAEQIFTVSRDVVMLIIAVMVFFWGRDRKQVNEALQIQLKASADASVAALLLRDLRLDEITRRLDGYYQGLENARHESSRAAGIVQTLIGRVDKLPEELRTRFQPIELAQALAEESRRDRMTIWEAVRLAVKEKHKEGV